MKLFEGYRTPFRQQQIFDKHDGSTNARAWQSNHNYGMAADFVFFENSNWHWKTTGKYAAWWDRFHAIGRAEGLHPLSWEQPHLELQHSDWKDLYEGQYPAGGDESWAANLAANIAAWGHRKPNPPPLPHVGPQRPPLGPGAPEKPLTAAMLADPPRTEIAPVAPIAQQSTEPAAAPAAAPTTVIESAGTVEVASASPAIAVEGGGKNDKFVRVTEPLWKKVLAWLTATGFSWGVVENTTTGIEPTIRGYIILGVLALAMLAGLVFAVDHFLKIWIASRPDRINVH